MERQADLSRQTLARALSAEERALSEALEAIYRAGTQDFAHVVAELNRIGVRAPSGAAGPWSVEGLHAELSRINRALDDAYAGDLLRA